MAVLSLSNSTAPHARHDALDALDTLTVSCRVVSRCDEPSGIWAIVAVDLGGTGVVGGGGENDQRSTWPIDARKLSAQFV